MIVKRRLSYKLYPSAAQTAEMERQLELHRRLYNAALQERRDAWARGIRVTMGDQSRSLKEFKSEIADWNGIHTHTMQLTLKRLDLAFQAFFRRVAAGQTPGYPRFKAYGRYPGWGYKEHGNGFRFQPGAQGRHGHIRLAGIGWIQVRGKTRQMDDGRDDTAIGPAWPAFGVVKTAEIIRKADGFHLSIVTDRACKARDHKADPALSLDWGVNTFGTLAREAREEAPHQAGRNRIEMHGIAVDTSEEANLRFLAQEAEALKDEQRAFSRSVRGARRTRRMERERNLLAKRARKVANRRKNHAHVVSARMVRGAGLICTEKLNVRNMTGSARGTVEKPGSRVAQKAGLNRSILDTAPAAFLNMLRYKAEEAGTEFLEVDTRKHKPSQTCPHCGRVEKKALSMRVHDCPECGFTCGRDVAAALNLLWIGLEHRDNGRVSAGAPGETPGTKPLPVSQETGGV